MAGAGGLTAPAQVDVQLVASLAEGPGDQEVALWAMAAAAPHTGAICVRVVDEDEGAALNAAWRDIPRATNVLAFPAGEVPGGAAPILGDVVICAPVVQREARCHGRTVRAHCAHMVVHGVLHLCGHDHQEGAAARRMEARESEVMRSIGFPDPWVER